MYKLNDCFDMIYCLIHSNDCLPENLSRVREMVKNYGGSVIDFWSGTKESQYSKMMNHVDVDQPAGWGGTKQSYNHYLCLRKIIQEAKAAGLKNFLFMEEDAVWTDKFEERFTKAWSYIALHDWDMFYFGANHCGPISTSPPLDEYKLCRTTLALGMHSVAINHTMYDEMLEKLDAENDVGLYECPYSDCTIAHLFHKTKNVYCIWPGVAWQLNKEPERFTDVHSGK